MPLGLSDLEASLHMRHARYVLKCPAPLNYGCLKFFSCAAVKGRACAWPFLEKRTSPLQYVVHQMQDCAGLCNCNDDNVTGCNCGRASLEEVACQNELDTSKWQLAAPEISCHLLQSIEHLSRDHGDLIQDKHLRGNQHDTLLS